MAQQDDDDYPGQRLGLPADGPGAVAGWGRRVLALTIDWLLSTLVVGAFVGQEVWYSDSSQFAVPGVFLVEIWLLTSLTGSSAGQAVTKVMVVRTSGERLDPWQVLVRTVLIILVIPPVIYDADQRGLHDLAVGSVTLRR